MTQLRFLRRWVAGGLVTGGALVVLARLSPLSGAGSLELALGLAFGGLAVLVGTLALGTVRGGGHATVSPTGLRWGERVLLSAFHEGDHVARGGGAYVSLRGPEGVALLRVADRAEGDRVLEAAGLDARRTREYALRKVGMAEGAAIGAVLATVFACVSLVFVLKALGAVLAALLLAGVVAGAVWHARGEAITLRVGADGLVLREGHKRTRFFLYSELADVDLTLDGRRACGLVLRFVDGSSCELDVPCVQVEKGSPDFEEPARPIRDRILAAKRAAASQSASEQGAIALALGRGGREIGEWIRGLRHVLSEPASYRATPVTEDALVQVLRDGSAPPPTRLAAAIALGAAASDEVRSAADACADPELATRIRIAVDADPRALEAALSALASPTEEDASPSSDAPARARARRAR